MQIELIGCSGAGKSTLARNVVRSCRAQGIEVVLGDEFVLQQARLDWIRRWTVRAAVVNLIAVSAGLAYWRRNLELYRFAARRVIRLPIPPLDKLYVFRNVLKKVGIGEIVRVRGDDQQIVLLDEGVLHVAHNLFVHITSGRDAGATSAFVDLISTPDAVVYVRQPASVLIERMMTRGHRRIPDRSYPYVECFVNQAIAVFDELVQQPAVLNRVLIVDGERDVVVPAHIQRGSHLAKAMEIIRSGIVGETDDRNDTSARATSRRGVPLSSHSLLKERG